jgi:SAM-dependent methyltransferase
MSTQSSTPSALPAREVAHASLEPAFRLAVQHVFDVLAAHRDDDVPSAFASALDHSLDAVRRHARGDRAAEFGYFRAVLHPLFLQAPLLARAFAKPRGYAGDYEMMNMIYRDLPEGDTALGRALHTWINSRRPCRAVRSRLGWLLERMGEHMQLVGDECYRTLSVACGPAQELQELVRQPSSPRSIDALCVDQDTEALRYAEAAVRRHAGGGALDATFLPLSIRDLLMTRVAHRRSVIGTRHFVYSLGLYDYLPDRVAVALTRALYDLLAPGGRLIVGNFAPCAATEFVMEAVTDWPILYRSAEEVLSLARALPHDARREYATEPTGLNGFLIVTKPRDLRS